MTAVGAGDLLQAGEALLDARKFDQALQLAAQILAMEPSNASAHALAAQALMGLDRHREAVDAATQLTLLRPHSGYSHLLLAVALRRSTANLHWPGDHYTIHEAQQAIRLEPTNAAAHTCLADALANVGNLKDADAAIRHALQLSPNDSSTWATASFVALKARHWTAAEAAARKALAINPTNYAATNNLGAAIRGQGNSYDGAVAFLEAARIDPRSPTARQNVEGIGFTHMNVYAAIILLPLLIFPPAFVAARLGVAGWLRSKPKRLRPLAQELGIRIATSKRYRRKFDKRNAHAQRLSAMRPSDWSALRGRQRVSTGFLAALSFLTLLIAAPFGAATFISPTAAGRVISLLIVSIMLTAGALMLRVIRRRRSFV